MAFSTTSSPVTYLSVTRIDAPCLSRQATALSCPALAATCNAVNCVSVLNWALIDHELAFLAATIISHSLTPASLSLVLINNPGGLLPSSSTILASSPSLAAT